MSWVYYFVLIVVATYFLFLFIINLYNKKTKINKFIIYVILEITIFSIFWLILCSFAGYNYQLKNKNFTHINYMLSLVEGNNYVYRYKNFIVRENEKIYCQVEICD